MMGSYMNFKNFGETPHLENSPLARQSSIYSLTFDELQNTLGGVGKDFGSMNMDELLKNIWTAEENQATATFNGGGQGSAPNGNLQLQGSLTLPRTLSQKTVDEVWRDLIKDSGELQLPQRQPTLGEITLEEFLVKAGVVREENQTMERPSNGGLSGFYSSSPQPKNNGILNHGFQQSSLNNMVQATQISLSNNLGRSSQPAPQPLFHKLVNVAFASPVPQVNNAHLGSSRMVSPIVGTAETSMNNALLHGLVTGNTMMIARSPATQISPSANVKSDAESPSLSPPSYSFSGCRRGRKSSGTMEKAMERRLRRMIKNRESAARSRARKQAYTMELEAEVAKLKEINQELQKKQEEILKTQKNKMMEKTKMPWGSKKRSLKRTLTGPW